MPQSTANPDFTFEVGKSYRTYDKKSSVTITKRSACYVSGIEENGETFRRKILKYAATYEYNGDGKVFEMFILHEHVHVSARDELPATADDTNSASDNDNAMASQPANVASAESETTAQPDNLYDDDSFSDAPGDNSHPEQDIPESRDSDSIHADIPGFTIVPSCEIKHPDYTAYPEAIHDDIPCVNVPACYTPATLSHAAVVNPITAATMRFAFIIAALLFVVYKFILPVIFMRKKDIRRDNTNPFMFSVGYKYPAYFHDKKQLLTVNERYSDKFGFLWLSVSDEDNISYSVRVKLRDDSYTELIDFKELERTCFAFQGWKPIKESKRAKYVKFEVGKSYTAHHRYAEYTRHFTILDRFAAVPADRPDAKHKTVWLKVRMSDSRLENEPVDGWTSVFVNREHNSEEYWSTSEFIFRADQPDVVQEIPALTPEITHEHKTQQKTRKHKPAPASDLEHKLIDTKDLHFADKRRALDHNTAVITSCMFPEAVISLLMSISPQAIIQLGVHMGLFIAKPKGKKIAIAELFATKLMASRELRAHVRTNSEIISAKSTASIPDGVKFVQLKHRQLGFIFTE